MPRVFVTRELPGDGIDRLRKVANVDVWPDIDPPPPPDLLRGLDGADGVLVLITDRIDAAVMDANPGLRIISNMGVGYDHIDPKAATERGILVTNTPGVLTDATADLAFALILGFARRLVEGERIVRDGTWPAWRPTFLLGRSVAGTTLGIVGLGAIGLAVARRARGFGMRVLYSSRSRKPEAEAELGLEWRSLDDLLAESDWVSIHAALTPETRGFIGRRELGVMRRDAVLVNTARGPVVDEPALIEALRNRRIGGAALDVYAVEPLPLDSPLLSLDNVLLAPHVGSATVETRKKMADLAVDNLIAFFEGRRPPACVNPEVLEK
jgi:glyoxylate reductase